MCLFRNPTAFETVSFTADGVPCRKERTTDKDATNVISRKYQKADKYSGRMRRVINTDMF